MHQIGAGFRKKKQKKQNACMFKKESTKLRVLRALVPYVPRAPRALVPYVFLCFMYHVPHVVLSYVIPVSCLCLTLSYVLLYFTCLALCMFSGYSCLKSFLLLCSSFLTCFRCYNRKILLCVSCLEAVMLCTSCAFGALAI